MRKHWQNAAALLAAALILTSAAISEAAGPGFSVSGDLDRLNVSPRYAVNSKNGDVLAVWTQLRNGDESYGRVYYALLERGQNGGYSVAVSGLLSGKKSFNARPFPLYIPGQNRYLVVWDNADPATPLAPSDILGRIVRVGGKTKGGIFTVAGNGQRLNTPWLLDASGASAVSGADAPSPQVTLAVSFLAVEDDFINQIGLHMSALNENFRSGTLNRVMSGDWMQVNGTVKQLGVYPDGIGATVNGLSIIPVIRHVGSGGSVVNEPRIVLVDPVQKTMEAWDAAGQQNASTGPRVGTIVSKNGDTIVLSGLIRGGRVENRAHEIPSLGSVPALNYLFSKKERSDSLETLIIISPKIIKSSSPPAKKTVGYQLTAADDGWIYRKKLKTNGRSGGAEKKVLDHGKSLQSMYAVPLVFGKTSDAKGKLEVLLLWQKKVGSHKHEIRANLLKLKL